jgi:hypothetical protein
MPDFFRQQLTIFGHFPLRLPLALRALGLGPSFEKNGHAGLVVLNNPW